VRSEANGSAVRFRSPFTACPGGTRLAPLRSPARSSERCMSDYIYAVRLGFAFGLLGVVLLYVVA
jgi:hypothetical protein